MACSFCPYPLKDDKISKLATDKIYKIIDQIDSEDENFKYVTFSQFNEPLLDSRIFEITKYAQDKNLKVLFITNGLLLNKEKNIENLLELKPNIKISLQVIDQTKHKGARGLNMELEKYIDTIINFCKIAKDKPMNITIDVGCNFAGNRFKNIVKKFLGLQTGDPSVPDSAIETLRQFNQHLKKFHNIASDNYKSKLQNIMDKNLEKNIFKPDYIFQEGYKIFDNITLKIKPFFYGRRISEFEPINDNFACNSEILGVLADGNVLPCCLAYDDEISLGNVKHKNLQNILKDGENFLFNLRNKNKKKHDVCKKCFGEPTKRGSIIRNLYNLIKRNN